MSRTDKDMPVFVKYSHGYIEHDHRDGICEVEPAFTHATSNPAHWLSRSRLRKHTCPRKIYTVDCIHDKQRAELQSRLDQARHHGAYKNTLLLSNLHPKKFIHNEITGQSHFIPPVEEFVADLRRGVLNGYDNTPFHYMLSQGRLPDCDQDRTHEIDLRNYPFIFDGSMHLYGRRMTGEDLSPRYDESIPCDSCDLLETYRFACSYELDWHRSPYKCTCDYCNPESSHGKSRAAMRAYKRNVIKAFNSGASLDEIEDMEYF